MPETDLVLFPGRSSLLAHNAQANVSPTWADPNDGGRPRLLDRMNSWSTPSALEGYASDAVRGILVSFWISSGSGCCWTKDGRESLVGGKIGSDDGLDQTRKLYLRTIRLVLAKQ